MIVHILLFLQQQIVAPLFIIFSAGGAAHQWKHRLQCQASNTSHKIRITCIYRLHLQQIAMNIWKQLLLRRKQEFDSLTLFGSLRLTVRLLKQNYNALVAKVPQ